MDHDEGTWVAYAGSHEPYDEAGTGRAGPRSTDRLRLSDLGKLAQRAQRGVVGLARADERPTFSSLIAEHLRADAEDLPVVEESWPAYELVNVQIGLEAWLEHPSRSHELLGMRGHRHMEFGLTDLMQDAHGHDHGPRPGNVSWTMLASGPSGETRRAVRAGVYLVTEDTGGTSPVRLAMLVLGAEPESGRGRLALHVVADTEGAAERAAAEIRAQASEHNVFRGQVVSFEGDDMFGDHSAALRFHPRPHVPVEEVILPPETLAAIRRQVVGVAEARERLLAARQHLKRGLLLYGPPGVGKTHTVRHLMSALTGVTIVRLTGEALPLIGTACSVARTLEPSMVVVEDVDLIAEDRDMGSAHPVLFQLLNEMDGLAEDADVVFLLTTNRAELLEPALAARPGRVDQAVALELPDREARRRLVELYRGDLDLDTSRLDAVLGRTEGVTASFLKELLRRAALLATHDEPPGGEGGAPLRVAADHLDAALAELLDTRNAMTRTLLGSNPEAGFTRGR